MEYVGKRNKILLPEYIDHDEIDLINQPLIDSYSKDNGIIYMLNNNLQVFRKNKSPHNLLDYIDQKLNSTNEIYNSNFFSKKPNFNSNIKSKQHGISINKGHLKSNAFISEQAKFISKKFVINSKSKNEKSKTHIPIELSKNKLNTLNSLSSFKVQQSLVKINEESFSERTSLNSKPFKRNRKETINSENDYICNDNHIFTLTHHNTNKRDKDFIETSNSDLKISYKLNNDKTLNLSRGKEFNTVQSEESNLKNIKSKKCISDKVTEIKLQKKIFKDEKLKRKLTLINLVEKCNNFTDPNKIENIKFNTQLEKIMKPIFKPENNLISIDSKNNFEEDEIDKELIIKITESIKDIKDDDKYNKYNFLVAKVKLDNNKLQDCTFINSSIAKVISYGELISKMTDEKAYMLGDTIKSDYSNYSKKIGLYKEYSNKDYLNFNTNNIRNYLQLEKIYSKKLCDIVKKYKVVNK